MSCDWNIHCVTCDDTHRFNDANHQADLMLHLIKHRDAIAALVDLVGPCGVWLSSGYGSGYGSIEPEWFKQHAGHELRPIDEYGALLGQCRERITCESCGTTHACVLDHAHAGAHSSKPLTSPAPITSSSS